MSDLKEAMASLAECPICLEPFTDPRMRDCLHTLCYKCLSDHSTKSGENGQFQCPVCRKDLLIPKEGTPGFPKNFFINSYMVVVRDMGTGARSKVPLPDAEASSNQDRPSPAQVEKACSNSEEGDECTLPEQFCLDCCEYLCKSCSKMHQRSKLSRSHILVAVAELTDEMLWEAMTKAEIPRCLKHNEELKLYCSTCKCAVCSVCSLISHQSHSFQEISAVDRDARSELAKAVNTLEDLIQDVRKQRDQFISTQEEHSANIASATAITWKICQNMQQLLAEKAEELEQKVGKIRDDCEIETNVQIKNLTLNIELLDSLLSFAKDLCNKGTVFNRLAGLPEVRSRLLQFQSSLVETEKELRIISVPNSSEFVAMHLDGVVLDQGVGLDEHLTDQPVEAPLEMLAWCTFQTDKSREKTERQQQQQLEEQEQKIREHKQQLQQCQQQVSDLKRELKQKEQQIEQQEQTVRQKEKNIQRQIQTIQEKEEKIKKMKQTLESYAAHHRAHYPAADNVSGRGHHKQ